MLCTFTLHVTAFKFFLPPLGIASYRLEHLLLDDSAFLKLGQDQNAVWLASHE